VAPSAIHMPFGGCIKILPSLSAIDMPFGGCIKILPSPSNYWSGILGNTFNELPRD